MVLAVMPLAEQALRRLAHSLGMGWLKKYDET